MDVSQRRALDRSFSGEGDAEESHQTLSNTPSPADISTIEEASSHDTDPTNISIFDEQWSLYVDSSPTYGNENSWDLTDTHIHGTWPFTEEDLSYSDRPKTQRTSAVIEVDESISFLGNDDWGCHFGDGYQEDYCAYDCQEDEPKDFAGEVTQLTWLFPVEVPPPPPPKPIRRTIDSNSSQVPESISSMRLPGPKDADTHPQKCLCEACVGQILRKSAERGSARRKKHDSGEFATQPDRSSRGRIHKHSDTRLRRDREGRSEGLSRK